MTPSPDKTQADAAVVAYQRGYEKGCDEVHAAWATDGKRMEEEARAEGERAGREAERADTLHLLHLEAFRTSDGNVYPFARRYRKWRLLVAGEIERGEHLRRGE